MWKTDDDIIDAVEQAYPNLGEDQVMAVQGERVVLRGVQVIVLDDLATELCEVVEAGSPEPTREAWVIEGLAQGSFDAAVEAHAGRSGEQGNKPGRYRAVKKAAWLEKGPRVVEPPIT